MRYLWIKDHAAKGELAIAKVIGENNVADGLSKHMATHKLDAHMKVCGVAQKSGRHELCFCLGARVLSYLEMRFCSHGWP